MKRIFISFLLLVCVSSIFAQDNAGKIVACFNAEDSDPITLNGQSEECFFTVSLVESEVLYTAYQMDIHLPLGMTVLSDEDGLGIYVPYDDSMYPKPKRGDRYHKISASQKDINTYTVVCMSQDAKDFSKNNGALFEMYIKASPFMKPGDVNITIDNIILTHNEWSEQDQQNHAYSYKPTVPCGGTITGVSGECNDVPFNISATNHWSTCILPFATEIPTGVKAYTSSTSDSENIFLTEANSIEAYKPYILYSENGFSGNVSGTVETSGYPETGIVTVGNLTGAIVPQTVKNGYILQKHNDVVQFYAIGAGDSFLVPAGKCWMNIAANDAKALNCVVEGNETAIQNVKSTSSQNGVYDLAGRRVSTLKQGGLYIKNGEKFVGK